MLTATADQPWTFNVHWMKEKHMLEESSNALRNRKALSCYNVKCSELERDLGSKLLARAILEVHILGAKFWKR